MRSWKLKFNGDLPMTDEYAVFADLNSDGLVDAISDGKVYYLEHDSGAQSPEPVTSNKYYEFVYKHDAGRWSNAGLTQQAHCHLSPTRLMALELLGQILMAMVKLMV